MKGLTGLLTRIYPIEGLAGLGRGFGSQDGSRRGLWWDDYIGVGFWQNKVLKE
jgi:hypothetical protein